MKKIIISFVLFVAPVGLVFGAGGGPYIGAKAGLMMSDIPQMSNATNVGIVIGSKIGRGLAIEGELTTTATNGDIKAFGNVVGEWDVMTIAGYGVYRTNRNSGIYFKGKAGFLYEDVTAKATGASYSWSGTDTGLSLGFGVGFNLGKRQMLEIEYTLVEQDINFLSVAITF